jgi:hypothetical protein
MNVTSQSPALEPKRLAKERLQRYKEVDTMTTTPRLWKRYPETQRGTFR